MAIIMVSHDLGVVAGRTDRVAVMYAGRVVEIARTTDLFERTRHRYSEALLAAMPKIDRIGHGFVGIPGSMPNPMTAEVGCEFAARCSFKQKDCRTQQPELMQDPDCVSHVHRCLHPVDLHPVDRVDDGRERIEVHP